MKNTGYRLGLYEKAMPNSLGWKEKLAAAHDAGFDYVEISIDETDEKLARLDMTSGERSELLKLMSEASIRIETMCLSGHRRFPLGSEDDSVRAHSLEIMQKAIVLARDLGIRVIQIAGYDEYYNTSNGRTRELFEASLCKSVDYAAAYGVILAFETMETDFLNTVDKAMFWVNRFPSPYLMVYPDSGNLTNAALNSGRRVLDDIKTGAGHIAAFHLKETVPGKYREIPFGTGHVDFQGIIDAAYRMGVRRFTGEFWHTGARDWEDELHKAAAFLRSQFKCIK